MTFSTNEINSVTFCGSGVTELWFNGHLVWGGSQPTPSVGGDVILHLTGGTTSSVTFSSGTVPNATFAQRQDIVEVEVGDGITTIGNGAFADCSGLTSITMASSVTTLGDAVFENDVTLSSLSFYATTPPTRGSGVFYDLPQDYAIYVPSGSVEAYKTAWSGSASHIQAIPTLGAYEIRAKMSDDSIVTVTSTTATIGDTNGHFTETSYLGDYFLDESNIVEIEFGSSIYGFGEAAFLSCSSLEYIRIHSLSPEFYSGYDPMWGQSGNGLLVFSMDLPVNYEVTYYDGDMPDGWEIRYIFERDVVITNSSQSNGVVSLTYNDEDMTMINLNPSDSTTISAGTLFVSGGWEVGKGAGQDVTVYAVPQPDAFTSTFDSINVSGVTSESLMQSGFNPTSEGGNSVLMYGVSAITFNVQYTYEGEPED